MKAIDNWFGLDEGTIAGIATEIGLRLAMALVIFIVGFWLARQLSKGFRKILERRETDESLTTFLTSLTSIGLKVMVIISVITQLGVEMTSFVALLGAAGLAIGMAFSGTLSNFAGGVIILLLKPFKVGDYIETQGEQGTVREVQIFNTILTTLDNKVIILANGAVANDTIINFTKAKKRRVDWSFGIAYGDDLKVAKELLTKFIKEDKRIMQQEENFVGLGELGDSSVNVTVRAWVAVEDYWPVFFDMNERVYTEFDAAGLSIPFPQMDVHIQKEEA
ncbi:MAG: mechanosensitive ion channel [bacterium]|nr:mechanosensitive ion channel [bacterium]